MTAGQAHVCKTSSADLSAGMRMISPVDVSLTSNVPGRADTATLLPTARFS
jgi:hypothetical protein